MSRVGPPTAPPAARHPRRSPAQVPAGARGGDEPPGSSRRLLVAAVAVLAACGPDRPVAAAGDGDAPLGVGGEDEARAATVTVFDEVPDSALERRLTMHVLVREPPDRAGLSRAMRELLPARAAEDESLVGIRAVAYYPDVQEEASEADLVPVAWAEWIPLEGWGGDVGAGRGTNHRVYFYFGTPPEW